MKRRRLITLVLVLPGFAGTGAALTGCAGMSTRQPLQVMLVDVSSLPSAGLEFRLAVKLRVQNPNESALDYDGVTLELEANGRHFASGVSSASGSVPRFGEVLITVPVSVSPTNVLRQALGLARDGASSIEFTASGRLAGGLFGGASFTSSGRFDWPDGPS